MGKPDRRASGKTCARLDGARQKQGETAQYFREQYQVSAARTALTMRAAAHAQAAIDLLPDDEVSLYIGIPFCPSRCAYCSFVSHSVEKSAALIPPYVEARAPNWSRPESCWMRRDLSFPAFILGEAPRLTADQLARLMDCVAKTCNLSRLREYTGEAGRPDTITAEKMAAIRAGGADRVSINPQTMNDAVLARIGRRHNAAQVLEAMRSRETQGFRLSIWIPLQGWKAIPRKASGTPWIH